MRPVYMLPFGLAYAGLALYFADTPAPTLPAIVPIGCYAPTVNSRLAVCSQRNFQVVPAPVAITNGSEKFKFGAAGSVWLTWPPKFPGDFTSTGRSASLSTWQATTVAIRLANEKASIFYHCQPFQDGQPARFVASHWVWMGHQGYGHGDFEVTVELAEDGSTNNVDLQLLDNQNQLLTGQRAF